MLRRLFWLLAGIAIGVWGTAKVNRAARRLTPESIAETAIDRAARLSGRLRGFADEVRTGMAEREAELNDSLGRSGAGARTADPAATAPGTRRHPGTDRKRKDDH